MSNAGSIKAGKAFVEIGGDDSKLRATLSAAERRLKSFSTAALKVGSALSTAFVAGVAAITPAIRIFAQFEEQMSSVRAVTGATAADFEALKAKARELGAATSFSAKEAAEGMKFLGMAGFKTQQILAGIPAVLDLAKAGAVELGVAADIASDVSSAFGLTAEEIKRVADVMAKAAASSNVSIEGLGESFKFAAPAGASAGQTIEEVSAALGTLGNSGLKGSIAGRNLQIMFTQLARTDVQSMLKDVGVSVADASGNFRDLHDIIADLKPALDMKTEIERVNFLNDAFGEGAKAAQILVSTSDGFNTLTKSLYNATGEASRMAKVMGDNLAGDFKTLMSAVEELALSIGDTLNNDLRDLTETATEYSRAAGEWIKNNKETVLTLAELFVKVGLIGGSLVTLAAAAKATAAAIGLMNAAIAVNPWFWGIAGGVAIGGAVVAGLQAITDEANRATDALNGTTNAVQKINGVNGAAAGPANTERERFEAGIRKMFPDFDKLGEGGKRLARARYRASLEQPAEKPKGPATDPLAAFINALPKDNPGPIFEGGLTSGFLSVITPQLASAIVDATRKGVDSVRVTERRVNANQAAEQGTAEAQRAIAEALAPRVRIEEKIAEHAQDTARNTENTERAIRDLVNKIERGHVLANWEG